jgi:hypothetical protein
MDPLFVKGKLSIDGFMPADKIIEVLDIKEYLSATLPSHNRDLPCPDQLPYPPNRSSQV